MYRFFLQFYSIYLCCVYLSRLGSGWRVCGGLVDTNKFICVVLVLVDLELWQCGGGCSLRYFTVDVFMFFTSASVQGTSPVWRSAVPGKMV